MNTEKIVRYIILIGLLILALSLSYTPSLAQYPSQTPHDGPTADIDNGPDPVQTQVTTTVLYQQYFTPAFGSRVGVFSDITIATADDFSVPAATTWTISRVDVGLDYTDSTGYTNTADVIFYNDAAGTVGSVACSRTNESVVSLVGFDRQITLTTPCVLGTGTYWLSITPRYTCASISCGSIRIVSANGKVGLEQHWFNIGLCGAAWGSMTACNAAVNTSIVFRLSSITNDTLVASAVCNGDNLDVTITSGDGPFLISAVSDTPSEPITSPALASAA